jgi:hypothetical protein
MTLKEKAKALLYSRRPLGLNLQLCNHPDRFVVYAGIAGFGTITAVCTRCLLQAVSRRWWRFGR